VPQPTVSRGWVNFDWQFEKLLQDLTKSVIMLDKMLPTAVDEFGDVATAAIRSLTPVHTGETRASIGKWDPNQFVRPSGPAIARAKAAGVYKLRRLSTNMYQVVIGSNSDRVVYQNNGTKHNQGHYMFERGGQMAARYFKPIVEAYIGTSCRALGTTPGGARRVMRVNSQFMPLEASRIMSASRVRSGRARVRVS
jgi:hypothetical protein